MHTTYNLHPHDATLVLYTLFGVQTTVLCLLHFCIWLIFVLYRVCMYAIVMIPLPVCPKGDTGSVCKLYSVADLGHCVSPAEPIQDGQCPDCDFLFSYLYRSYLT